MRGLGIEPVLTLLSEMPAHSAQLTNKLILIKYKKSQKEQIYRLRVTQGIELFAQVNTQNNVGFNVSWGDMCDRIDGKKQKEELSAQETIYLFEQLKKEVAVIEPI